MIYISSRGPVHTHQIFLEILREILGRWKFRREMREQGERQARQRRNARHPHIREMDL